MPETFFRLLFILFLLLGGMSCGRSGGDSAEVKSNSPPVILSAAILPEKPGQENDLGVVVQGSDPDRDAVTYHYQWIKNEAEMAGENGNVLKRGKFRKGDFIRVRITPFDGKTEGTSFLSDAVEILNSLPAVLEVNITPPGASVMGDLIAVVKGNDPDGDFIYFEYTWERNETVLPEERKETLKRTLFRKGDTISVTAIPSDREATGVPKKSAPIVISNSPPMIVSSPPSSNEGTIYRYQVKAEDPDHDPVTFTLKSGPAGMEIDKHTGLILWKVGKTETGTHSIVIEAADNEGATSRQQFVISVDIKDHR